MNTETCVVAANNPAIVISHDYYRLDESKAVGCKLTYTPDSSLDSIYLL